MTTETAAFPASSKDIGDLLELEGYVTKEQLTRARRVHGKLEVKQSLSEVLVKLGYVYGSQVREVMKKHKRGLRIGDFLLEMRFIGEEDLRKALQQQKAKKKKIGEILVENGALNEMNLCQALSEQCDCPIVDPDLRVMDKRLLVKASPKFLRKHAMIPFTDSNEGVVVIFSDPTDEEALKAARQIYLKEIIPALATKESIIQALDSFEEHPELAHGTIEVAEGAADAIGIVDHLIQSAIEEGVSDLHFEPLARKLRVRYRKDGVLVLKTEFPKMIQESILSRIKVMAGADIADKRRHQDGKINYEFYSNKVDLRMSSYVTMFGENIVLRLLSQKQGLKDLAELGMPSRTLSRYIAEVLEPPSGVVIMTGPTGSGKTTTLYSSLNYCNDPSIKIITVEDPVEYVIEGIMQCSVKPEIGLTFEETLKAIVRQDPDIVVLGEIRDRHSAEVAVQAALTGHKVFSTFHTEDAAGAIIRLMDMNIETSLIASTVLAIVAQRLLRRICEFCKEKKAPDPIVLGRIGLNANDLKDYTFYRGTGCENCHYTGYRGRVGVYELLVLNEKVRETILEKRSSFELRRDCLNEAGLVTLMEDGIGKLLRGLTTADEVRKHLPYTSTPRPVREILALTEG